jgi:hypothetical protein
MISHDDIRQVQQYPSGPDTFVLSLYVDVDQSKAANLNRGFETAVEALFRKIADSQGENHKHFIETECSRVLDFLRDYTPRGKGLVIFSDSTRDFWWQRDLRVAISTNARFSPSPWVRPLIEALEARDRFGVALIDKHRARLFAGDAAGLELVFEFETEIPGKHMTTGTDHIWSQSQMERDHANHIRAHARRAAEEFSSIVERDRLARVVIGGPVEATSIFEGELPRRIQQMIAGTVSLPMDASHERLLQEVGKIIERAEHEDEVRLVESMITSAMKGDRAVLGIEETLEAIRQGRIYCLVVAKDFRIAGKQCRACRVLLVDSLDACSYCGGELASAPDLINRASHRVLEQAGRVQIVSGAAAEKLAGSGIGAVLRF